ncbi:MAG: VOC family protein [Azospirillum sp.]|nr:VOC family protein [Azospirillum sp.]
MTAETPSNPPPPGVLPHIVVADGDAAIAFYKAAFGAVEAFRMAVPGGTKVMHACLLINGGTLMLCDDFPEYCGGTSRAATALGGSPVTLHLNVADVDAAFARAVAAGAEVTMPLADQFWGARYGTLRDPFGHSWSLSTEVRVVPPEELAAAAAACMKGTG